MLGLPVNTRAPPRSTRRALSSSAGSTSSWTSRRYLVLVLFCMAGALVVFLNAQSAKSARLGRRSLSRPRTSSGLYGKDRVGAGAEVERACGERNKGLTLWLDVLQGLEAECPALESHQRAQIVKNAKHQCGSWCLWDLDVPARVGWYLTGPCFVPFEGSHPDCDHWWTKRPGHEQIDDLEQDDLAI
ncbi:hypothetical protein RHOSPDRAFT_25125 [Rhodotorula sp. JG-1b]|nr:hypothetical protein RHOSPDRAFT_25125 [Rhodotorula sp. JG-1b]